MKNLAFYPNDAKSQELVKNTDLMNLCFIICYFSIVKETEKAILISGFESYWHAGGQFSNKNREIVNMWIPKSIITIDNDESDFITYWVPEWFNSRLQFIR